MSLPSSKKQTEEIPLFPQQVEIQKSSKRRSIDENSTTRVVAVTASPSGHNNEASPSHIPLFESPREWLEYYSSSPETDQIKESSTQNTSCDGAYTVMRYDCKQEHLWGKDFHFQRLVESYKSLCRANGESVPPDASTIQQALHDTSLILNHWQEQQQQQQQRVDDEKDERVEILIMTIFWAPDNDLMKQGESKGKAIKVRGHAKKVMMPSVLPEPIAACVAIPDDKHKELLPNRFDYYPRAKLSSWCLTRRPLEQKPYKDESIGEVLLVQSQDNDKASHDKRYELLEGLTSNLFVLYKKNNNSTSLLLQTPPSRHVLPGYVRSLVLNLTGSESMILPRSKECQILLEDTSQWEEVFVTSSIRLIVPVDKIFLPDKKVLWSRQSSSDSITRQIHSAILNTLRGKA